MSEHDHVHAPRRDPETPQGPIDLIEQGRALLDEARELDSGRSARTLTPGAGEPLKQTLVALVAGRAMQEHTAPGPATLQVLQGSVELVEGSTRTALDTGQWAVITPAPHSLEASTDAVALLSVAPNAKPR